MNTFPNLPEPDRQLKPLKGRKYKLDFAWAYPTIKLGVEIQGGSFTRGGHNTGVGQARDYEKNNLLVQDGWKMLYFNTQQLKDLDACVLITAEVLTGAEVVE